MRILLDACVLFPSVLREMLLGAAAAGGFAPLWSARILEEWARATRRLPEGAEAAARAEIARLRAEPGRTRRSRPIRDLEARLSLPDPDDLHVLAAAIAGRAEALLTLNRADFPTRTLARHGLILREPDGFLCELLGEGVDIAAVAETVRARGEALSGRPAALRAMLKRGGSAATGQGAGAVAAARRARGGDAAQVDSSWFRRGPSSDRSGSDPSSARPASLSWSSRPRFGVILVATPSWRISASSLHRVDANVASSRRGGILPSSIRRWTNSIAAQFAQERRVEADLVDPVQDFRRRVRKLLAVERIDVDDDRCRAVRVW